MLVIKNQQEKKHRKIRKKFISLFLLDTINEKMILDYTVLVSDLKIQQDDIFDKFIHHPKNNYLNYQICSMTYKSPSIQFYSKGSLFEQLMIVCVNETQIAFYKIDFSKWEWIPYIKKEDLSESLTSEARDKKKQEEDSKIRERTTTIKKKVEEIFTKVTIEKEEEKFYISTIDACYIKDEKEPVLLIKTKDKKEFYIHFSSDFSLQNFINYMTKIKK